jgi:hypothetical protein
MSYNVTVNFNGSSFGVRFQPTWNISRLKREIARDRNVDPSAIKVIFAGQELPDSLTLEVRTAVVLKYSSSLGCGILNEDV